MVNIESWVLKRFGTDTSSLIKVLEMSPSSQGYIQGAVSELKLFDYLTECGYDVYRIKEKPAGGFDEKKEGYKGDFLIRVDNAYYVVECKGIKTNAEFRSGDTDAEYEKHITRQQAVSFLKKYINIDRVAIYQKGLKKYLKKKTKWEKKNPGRTYPEFRWDLNCPGPDSPDLTNVFPNVNAVKEYVNSLDDYRFSETAFREGRGAYVVIQTHKPSKRLDPETNETIAAPLISDFSILAVDLFLRTGKHEFVFVNPNTISHSPDHPNHLYQNYIIDILIPGKKEDLNIIYPWYTDVRECIKQTKPKSVGFDDSQLDHRH